MVDVDTVDRIEETPSEDGGTGRALPPDHHPSVDIETFVRVFDQHKSFTEELLGENQRLRQVVSHLRTELKAIEARRHPHDVAALQDRIRILEEENRELSDATSAFNNESSFVEGDAIDHTSRLAELEKQNTHLVSIYVSMYRLHSTLSYDEALKSIKEIVNNMIGAELFELYLFDDSRKKLSLLLRDGPAVRLSDSGVRIVRESLSTGESYLCPFAERHSLDELGEPVACIPMKFESRVIGVLVIHELLVQKDGFEPIDHELFDVLGVQAATSLIGSYLYALNQGRPDLPPILECISPRP